ncbi:MAG: ComF family protein [Longimicrobiaceae bacterium]
MNAARRLLTGLLQGTLDLVYAPVCLGCGGSIATAETERLVCRTCWARARPLPAARCERCWDPIPLGSSADSPCPRCQEIPPAVRVIRSAFLMAEPVRELVHALKYLGWEAVAVPLAARMLSLPLPEDVEEEARLVVPVPISRVRLRERGYNQAELLAAAFADQSGRVCEPALLARTRANERQTALHPSERRANVAGAFTVPQPRRAEIGGEHVLLIDDVWTTGATALSCAEALLEGGARVVSVLTFARALPDLDR